MKKELEDLITDAYINNGLVKASQITGVSQYLIRKYVKSNNLKKKRKVELSNFANINKKEVSYYLGFFWSDGYIYRDEVSITIKESDYLELFSIFSTFGIWNTKNVTKKLCNNIYKGKTIYVNDKYIRKFLVDNNSTNKSLASPSMLLDKIPDSLKPYFFRGLFDGDGCFSSKNRSYFSITGNINQDWSHVTKLFTDLDIRSKYKQSLRKSGSSSYITISSQEDIQKLGNYIYNDNFDIGLSRKYDEYIKITTKVKFKNLFKQVRSIDDYGVIKDFSKIIDVELDGFSSFSVGKCCRGKQDKHKGLRWFYL